MSSLLIKDGEVVSPVGKRGRLDILVENGKILLMEPHIDGAKADRVIDAFGSVVAPGLVDTHAHFRDPGQTWKEDILTGAEAAKRGGYTSVVMMANTVPPIDNVETLHYVLEKGRKTGIKIYACANVTQGMEGKQLTDMEALYQAGAVGFTDDGKPILDGDLVKEAMLRAKALGVPISLHEEDPAFIETPGFNRGEASRELGIGGANQLAETVMVSRDVKLALETGAKVVFQHVSTAGGVNLIYEAKSHGGDIHAEATPHHFSLTEMDAIRLKTLAKMNPPLRTEVDRETIIWGLENWVLDIIATDHAPHSAEEKAMGLLGAPSGVIGLETALSLGITNLVKPQWLSLNHLIMRMSTNPAHVYGLEAGTLTEGKAADIVIFDQFDSWVVTDDFASRSKNSPFIGERLNGKVKYTICDGEVVYQNTALP